MHMMVTVVQLSSNVLDQGVWERLRMRPQHTPCTEKHWKGIAWAWSVRNDSSHTGNDGCVDSYRFTQSVG
jgi:hypothetical protein